MWYQRHAHPAVRRRGTKTYLPRECRVWTRLSQTPRFARHFDFEVLAHLWRLHSLLDDSTCVKSKWSVIEQFISGLSVVSVNKKDNCQWNDTNRDCLPRCWSLEHEWFGEHWMALGVFWVSRASREEKHTPLNFLMKDSRVFLYQS